METEPTATAAQATAVQTTAVQTEAAYPQPVQNFAAISPYPGPSEGVNYHLDWTAVEEMILDGQVAKIYHAPTGHVTLELKDGTLALALEPTPDDVFKVIERCGQACSDIEQVNE